MMLLVIGIFSLIAFTEIPSLVQKKLWRELVVFSLLFILAFTVCVLHTAGVNVPSPMRGIKYFIEEVLKISYKD